ncbi:hypothetical protein BEWA_027060 [Theileria equi strain WA]|uniref:Uncharacterized protein n=1 Tax=Theileria equi strain WA TaxID=1537102 RepID=L0AW85_THEEQ|nr:hypothetical protein BEWA_027060 [Theileria equi strain WA]AFZ79857.1 hypothetical protein BEWA_027060 [Theileria equi strain WA]|eukprot:XP_004829523.1 hypothetical protein BEWA_027060 [Theileria equi strain WA]
MNGGVRLDLDPTKFNESYGDIKGSKNYSGVPEGYTSYKYANSGNSQAFVLFALLFKEKLLPGILQYPTSVISVRTYFDTSGTKLLLIYLTVSDGNHKYYLNPDTGEELENVIFTEFVSKNKETLSTPELTNVLYNITLYHGFNLIQFNIEHETETIKVIGGNSYLIFDLSKITSTYKSEVTQEQVTLSRAIKIDHTYSSIKHHTKYSSFYVKGIKLGNNSEYMKVKGGFPNDPLTEFNVYYTHDKYDPYLVTLKITFIGGAHIPSEYYLTKTKKEGTGEWDIRKVGSHIDKVGISKILRNISENNRLDVSSIEDSDLKNKLGDISKGLSIDLTLATDNIVGQTKSYNSEGIRIPYKKEKIENYWKVIHAYGMPSFILSGIQVSTNQFIEPGKLPPSGTLFAAFNVYYTGEDYKEPVIIEVICLYDKFENGSPRYTYYYSQEYYEDKWVGYFLTTTFKDIATDLLNVIEHVKKNNHRINLGNLGELNGQLTKYPPDKIEYGRNGITDIVFDLTKKPKGSNIESQTIYQSNINGVDVNLNLDRSSIPGYHRVKHYLPPDVGKSLSIGGIMLPSKTYMKVDKGFPNDHTMNFFAYYNKSDKTYDDPLLITLTISNVEADPESTPDIYLIVKTGKGTKWDVYLARKLEEDDDNNDLTAILQNASNRGFNFDELEEQVKGRLIKYTPVEHITSGKSTLRKVLEGFGGTTAGGLATAEAVNYTLNTGWSIFRRVTAIFTAAI